MAAPDPAWARYDGAADVLTLRVHVQPGASRTGPAGIHGDRLKIRLAAPPVEGKANAALRLFIADAFAVPQRSVELTAGELSRQKTLRVSAPKLRPDREWAQDSAKAP
ncbi:MAG: YggU family protein [Betaproteobacteria bacterium]|nr:YggU family protein [Betaproteobacteria bacterium]MBK9608318.1 YggU family protein [Betaproteobacteria bacterium]